MKQIFSFALILAVMLLAGPAPLWAQSNTIGNPVPPLRENFDDGLKDYDGLKPAPGREDVYYACNACHSITRIRQQHLDRAGWEQRFAMLEQKHLFPKLTAEEREGILKYLVENYGPAHP